jgi:hypothetical protein
MIADEVLPAYPIKILLQGAKVYPGKIVQSTNMSASNSLRYVLIYVHQNGKFPPRKKSKADIALLRAANLAMRRKAQGMDDSFLFIFSDASSFTAGDDLIAYGFPNTEIIQFCKRVTEKSPDFDQELLSEEHDSQTMPHQELNSKLAEEVVLHITRWLEKKHPAAITFPKSEYGDAGFWWVGVEHNNNNVVDWPFETSKFIAELPSTHRAKGRTWLAVLNDAMQLQFKQENSSEIVGQLRVAAVAATLCEWLHGFEAASRNSDNNFDPDSVISSLGLTEFFLGFEAARISSVNLENFCEDYVHNDDPFPVALKLITENLRSELCRNLTSFFGGDTQLFWALYAAIWPEYDLPTTDAIDKRLNDLSFDNLAKLDDPWRFVTEGWCESAYA